MIPKIIHYIWLGKNPMPKVAQKCLKSWRKFCPDYQIICWNEDNLDLNKYQYVREAYDAKKYAFASDVLRFEKLYECGGVYLDVDVELIKPIDEFLNNKCFTGLSTGDIIAPGLIFGSEKNNPDLKNILDGYTKRHFIVNGKNDITTVCEIVTDYYETKGLRRKNELQELNGITVYPIDYFDPINTQTNKKRLTKHTHAIHWYAATWYTPWQKFRRFVKKVLNFFTFGFFGKVVYRQENKHE